MFLSRLATGLLLLGLTGCSWLGLGKDENASGTGHGYVVGDEPTAVETGAWILSQGGSAADAATAMYFVLAVTYPVSAGLGGGGLCVVRDRPSSKIDTINFLARDSASGGDFGIPGNVRGFAVLQESFGRLSWQRDVAPAEGYAAAGFPISQALETRLRASQDAIRLDASLAAEFLDESGTVKPAGTRVSDEDLGTTLSAIRVSGPNALYNGVIANKLVAYSESQGGAFKLNELADYPVDREAPAVAVVGDETVYLPPRKVGAGAFAGALFGHSVDREGRVAGNNPGGAVTAATKAAIDQFGLKSLPQDLGATGFAAVDNKGQAVACAVTLNGAFGSGHTAADTGIVLARAPSSQEAGLSGAFLSPMIAATSDDGPLVFAGAGSGGPNATEAIVYALLRSALNEDITRPGNLSSTGDAPFQTINVIACQNDKCAALPDPAAQGLGAVAQ